ncbi:aminodeoxychorismate synthase component I, partial [Candidatus Latescibacterota bacterium]
FQSKSLNKVFTMKDQVVIHNTATKQWMRFDKPEEVFIAHRTEEVIPCLNKLEEMVWKHGMYAAGFLSYEAAPAFDEALCVKPMDSFPLVWFGMYSRPEVFHLPVHDGVSAYTLGEWIPSVSISDYEQTIAQIKELIARGDTYQVNYTYRLNTTFTGDSWSFFLKLIQAQQTGYAAYIDMGRYIICSASPELFFCLDGDTLVSRPMKGTVARGRTLAEDKIQSEWLYNSEKNRAENIMIVDMIRNDMGRIANIGSVEVTSFYDIERYPTLFQMTSTVASTTSNSVAEIITALFPCASITGAPKPRTMQIISELETTPRRIYTGSIGYIAPDRKAQFNVAIRTVLIDKKTEQAEYGFGGGIVWDSESADEYNECQVKARILASDRPEFSLLETILWTSDNGYFLLDYHFRRLLDSAEYFDYNADIERIEKKLKSEAASFSDGSYKVRLLVSKEGTIICQSIPLKDFEQPGTVRLRLSHEPVDSGNLFLYHKTTNRRIYDAAKTACPDCDDVLLFNERDEITESCIANIIVKINGELLTPPVECGLLPGTFRAWLLDRGEVKEKILTIDALKKAEEIYVINSVRKWQHAVILW